LQLLMVTAMEPPVAFTADEVRDEKVKVLRALRPIHGADVSRLTVRGQYGPGNAAGHACAGYRQEANVSPSSTMDTFVAMQLEVDNWRFAGVPIFVRAGKRLARRVTEISIHFKNVPHSVLAPQSTSYDGAFHADVRVEDCSRIDPDVLAIRIQPDEGIALRFAAKVPGPTMTLRPVTMDFRYGSVFGGSGPEAYERLILDAMLGDPTLFARADEVSAAWRFITPILQAWGREEVGPGAFPNYAAGTWGPRQAFDLIERGGRAWRRL
jgi:glucose-6-phosphate 1-dehydrogenase